MEPKTLAELDQEKLYGCKKTEKQRESGDLCDNGLCMYCSKHCTIGEEELGKDGRGHPNDNPFINGR